MPDALVAALSGAVSTPGILWLMLTISAAGLVRGFSGFGTALIFVPVANIFLEPKEVIVVIALTGIASNAVILPRAWQQGSRGEVGVLVLAALITVPLGLWALDLLDANVIRWIITFIAGGMLAALIVGWRYSGAVTRPVVVGIGAAAGVIGGMTGLTGPAVVLFYLAGQSVAQSVRANTILFLAALDVVLIANLMMQGAVTLELLALAFVLSLPYAATTILGQRLFHPDYERVYRAVAYIVIALAVLSGLPIWA